MRRFTVLAAISFAAAISLSSAHAQILRKGAKDRPETPAAPGAAAPAAPVPGETPGQTRREGRQEAREARQEARAVGESRPEARQTARDSRQGTRANIQASRAADLGLWFNTRAADGLVISDLTDNGMFATAGFREGDRIVSINGQPVTTEAQFVQFLTGPNVGTQPIQIVVIRGGQQQTLVLQPTVLTEGVVTYDPLYQYGIVIDDRNPNQYVIQRVYPRTPAYYAGLRAGDVITTIGGQRITSIDMLTQSLVNADAAIPLQVTRAGQTRDVQLDAAVGADSSVRTALRPDLDAAARGDATLDTRGQAGANIDTRGQAGANVDTRGQAGANIDARGQAGANLDARGQAGATRAPDSATAPPRTPESATAPARTPDTGPVTPAAPQAAPGAPATPRAGDRPNPPSGTTPATPATPARPGVSPATPATPATPAAPKAGQSSPTNPGSSPAPAQPKAGAGGANPNPR